MPLKEEEKCEKTRQIMEIWSSGLGVVCLQLFQHSLSVEALTREAAMIQALGNYQPLFHDMFDAYTQH